MATVSSSFKKYYNVCTIYSEMRGIQSQVFPYSLYAVELPNTGEHTFGGYPLSTACILVHSIRRMW